MNLDDVKQFFANKNVILVGNSVELMNHEYADFIDSHDIVVRFGKAIAANEREKKSIGRKIDVWVTGSFRAPMIESEPHKSDLKDVLILYNQSRVHMTKPYPKPKCVQNSFDLFSDEEVIEFNKLNDIEEGNIHARRMSVGLWTIKFMCEKIQTYRSLTIIGFDFFAKYTKKKRGGESDPCSWHLPISTIYRETHWHEQEVKIVQKYADLNLLKWIILSDLCKQEIKNTKYGKF